MRFKITTLVVCIFLFKQFSAFSYDLKNINIVANISGDIITNLDVEKEINYLKLLNPNTNTLDNEQLILLGKNSLIKEIIKKKELAKYVKFDFENNYSKNYLKKLITQIGYVEIADFEDKLKIGNNYTFDEIEKKIYFELLWNDFILSKYENQININKKKLTKKLEGINYSNQKQYLLSEILFKKKSNQTIDSLGEEITQKIEEIGFDNTANLFSISESAKTGGKLDWVDEKNLSETIKKELSNLKEGENTNIIKIKNNYLILKIEKIRENKIQIDKDKALNDLINYEKTKQLNQFSRMYFDKMKINYMINEK
jgi:peptidyl-prolyl cis-trans isomerase SurA